MADDDLVTQGAVATVAMGLSYFSRNILISASK